MGCPHHAPVTLGESGWSQQINALRYSSLMGIFNKKPVRNAFDDYHGNIETRHWTAIAGSNLQWDFEVEIHTDNPPSIRYRWIKGERNRITELDFVRALRYLHGRYGWRYIEVVDKDERDRAEKVSDDELIIWKEYGTWLPNFEPSLFGFGEPMTKG